MKTGKTLTELAMEIERQRETKRDFIAPASAVHMIPDYTPQSRGAVLELAKDSRFAINGVAHDQIGEFAGIPAKYYDRMLADAPALLASNVNHWLEKSDKKRMVRTLDGTARAFLSDGFRTLENADLAEAVLPVLLEKRLEIMSCEITERRLYIKAVDPRINRDVPSGRKIGDGPHVFFDTCSPALIISNSEVGHGQLSIESGVWTKMCTNLAVFANAGMKKRHVGARQGIYEMLTTEAKAATDKAVWLQVRDVAAKAFEEAAFDARVAQLAGMKDDEIVTDDVQKVVEITRRRFDMSEGEGKSILKNLIAGADLTRYGLFNAITRTAQDLDSYDRASEFEKIGGVIVELPKSEWKVLAEAA